MLDALHCIASPVSDAASGMVASDGHIKIKPTSNSLRHFFMAARPAISEKGK
jgi:hypothetical protein